MSASDKKKLRAAERAEKLTEKQLTEQKEAKKLKIMTAIFAVVMALTICIAVVVGVTKTIEGSGSREKKTVALTIGDQEISNAELNYYYINQVQNFANQYGDYLYMVGLDTTKPLNEQVINEELGKTWADNFMDSAVENAKAVYTLCAAAEAEGFTLTEEDNENIEAAIATEEMYALYYYQYPSLEDYLKAVYGFGATVESFREFYTMGYLADAYQKHYIDTLTYEDADLREAEAADYLGYNSYSYNYYYLTTNNYVEAPEGTSAADYTAEQKAAAAAKIEDIAKILTAEDITSLEALDAAIAALPSNADVANAASFASNDMNYHSMNSIFADWVADESRKAGDVEYFKQINSDGEVTGIYVIMFNSATDNNFPLVNVRHVLVGFEGGTTDSTTGTTVYSDVEKDAAHTEAMNILNEWKNGEATEDSFATLANEKSDDGDGTTGGLYENVIPGQMVPNFNDWIFDETRKAGDTGLVETEYGWHVMYFVGNSDVLYRDYMIENDLKDADYTAWYEALMADVTATIGDTKYIATDLVLQPAK